MREANDSGGIEGLPLQLMITILVATLGTAIILGWMGNIESPHYIGSVDPEYEVIELDGCISRNDVVFTVTDQDGNPLEGAVVTLTGLGVNKDGYKAYGITGTNGKADLGKLSFTSSSGRVTVDVSHPDYGDKQIKVVVL
jgi:hypothetical protein